MERDSYEPPSSYFGKIVNDLPHGFGVNFTPQVERIELGWFSNGNLIRGQKVEHEVGVITVEEGLFSEERLS